MNVAKASGTNRVVINSGGKSERFVKALYPDLPQQAFVEYGNYIGETLKMAHELDIREVTLGVMLGKAVKLAAGHLGELWQVIPPDKIEDFCHVVLQHCMDHCSPLVPQAHLTILLIDDDGIIHSQ